MKIGIITIIRPELDAICREFQIDVNDPLQRKTVNGDIYFTKRLIIAKLIECDIIVYCQKNAGNILSGIATTKIIERFNPDFMFLCGIAAGYEKYCKIGDVIVPRIVGNNSTRLYENGAYHPRYVMLEIQAEVADNLMLFSIKHDEWYTSLNDIHKDFLNEGEYESLVDKTIVNRTPDVKDTIIVSADVLIKDARYFEQLIRDIHDKIRSADMEAVGFASACEQTKPQVAWLVVRGISDFGDPNKKDNFHNRAASAAASWLGFFLRNGLDSSLYLQDQDIMLQVASGENSVVASKDEENKVSAEIEIPTVPADLLAHLKIVSENINKNIRNEDQ